MNRNRGDILGEAAEAAAAWDDETRIAFDKRYVELIERKMEAYELALANVQKAIEEINRFINSLSDL